MTYLFSFIDDASRFIPHSEFFFDEKLPRLDYTMKFTVAKRGIPDRLFTDNGKIFQATQLELICAELKIQLIYGTLNYPEGHGKIEKWYATVETDFSS